MSPIRQQTTLLGKDYPTFGELEVQGQGAQSRSAAAISVGSDALSISRALKTNQSFLNEDALLVLDDGPRTLLAVADAHFGHESSHVLIQRLGEACSEIPVDSTALTELVTGCLSRPSEDTSRSETTLVVATLDHDTGAGVGCSFGDSTATVVSVADVPRPLNRRNRHFVAPGDQPSARLLKKSLFEFTVRPGSLLTVFTDGVNECCYGKPRLSIQMEHLQELCIRCTSNVERFVRELGELALEGVRGKPGGQDNLAIAAVLRGHGG